MIERCDVAIVGGGVAGSTLAGVLAQAGLGVAVVEKEKAFRDRVRGEGIHPWGVAEAKRLGLLPVLREAGANELPIWQSYTNRHPDPPYAWADDSIDGLPELGVFHPRLQETSLRWAAAQGATVLRPARAAALRHGAQPELEVLTDRGRSILRARLIVGADGRTSVVRRWIGATAVRDPIHHRIGGGLIDGVALDMSATHAADFPGGRMFALPQGGGRLRAYLVCSPERFAATRPDRTPAAFIAACGDHLPAGVLAEATIAGPVAFFPNADIWSSQTAADGVVLIGDAAGANDPSVGQGLSLVYRDVRELRDLLLDGGAWRAAIAEFARRRASSFAVLRAHARWVGLLTTEEGPEADARRERVARAREIDPSAGGFALIYARGPDGLVTDEAARRRFFGEDVT